MVKCLTTVLLSCSSGTSTWWNSMLFNITVVYYIHFRPCSILIYLDFHLILQSEVLSSWLLYEERKLTILGSYNNAKFQNFQFHSDDMIMRRFTILRALLNFTYFPSHPSYLLAQTAFSRMKTFEIILQ